MISKHTLTGQNTYTDRRIFQSCSALVFRCENANITTNAKIEVTLNDGSGGQKLIPNMRIHDIAEIAVQRHPVGHYLLNELYLPVCDFGCLNLGEDTHLVVSVTGLESDKTYELIAYSAGQGKLSDKPIIYSNNTVPVGSNKKTITSMPGAILALPNSEKIIEASIVYKATEGKAPVTERMNLEMLKIEQRLDNGEIAYDILNDPNLEYRGYINWLTRAMNDFAYIELDIDETGLNYIIAENVNIS